MPLPALHCGCSAQSRRTPDNLTCDPNLLAQERFLTFPPGSLESETLHHPCPAYGKGTPHVPFLSDAGKLLAHAQQTGRVEVIVQHFQQTF
jgi:hypothetical protein